MVTVRCAVRGVQVGAAAGVSGEDQFFGLFAALSTVAFAFGGHNIALEIQATLPAARGQSTIKPM